jgi:RNA polymerase sigma factor (sigma-70 family)
MEREHTEDTAASIAARHHASLFRWALALARGDRAEAEEILQLCYLEVIEGRADLLRADNQKSFLFGVVRNIAASRRRRASMWGRVARLQWLWPEPPRAADPEEACLKTEAARSAWNALGALTGRQLEIATLAFNEDMTIEEASAVMGISLGTARSHYHRAKQKLCRALDSEARAEASPLRAGAFRAT